jgi:Tfp pilus assembly protein PilX
MTNQANINAAIETARAKVAGNAAWTRSVEKAAALVAGEIIVTVLMDGGIVSGERGTYRIKNSACSCPAGQNGMAHCYHKSALRITEMAETMPNVETAPAICHPISASVSVVRSLGN